MSLSRSIAFKDLAPQKFPKPTIVHHKNHFVQGAFASSGDSFQASGTMMPDVIEAGWLFSTTDQDEIQTILEVVTNGLVRMATYLEDGYLNYRTKDYPFPYDHSLLAGVVIGSGYEPGISALGRSQWVPGVRIGLILNETNELANAFYRDPEHNSHSNTYRKQAELIVNEGAGALVPSMCNTYVFCWLLKDGSYDEIERVLDSPIRLEIPRETTNAMSNLGISKYMSGDSDRAIQLFTDALAREDGEAEAEASFYLSRIYAGQSNKTKATDFEARCAAAGGYETFDGSDRIDATDGTPAPARSGGDAGGGALPKSSKGSLGGSGGAPVGGSSSDGLGKKNGGLGSLSTSTDDASPGLSKTNGSGLGGPASTSESQLPKASSGGGSAKFCPSCGNAFTSPEQKFCPECGIPRP
jgi:hypothetical protein